MERREKTEIESNWSFPDRKTHNREQNDTDIDGDRGDKKRQGITGNAKSRGEKKCWSGSGIIILINSHLPLKMMLSIDDMRWNDLFSGWLTWFIRHTI